MIESTAKASFIFFNRLRENYPLSHKLHFILEDAGYHRINIVKNVAHSLNIELDYLPLYSPNRNPIERLSKVMNEKITLNLQNKRNFIAAIDEYFAVTLPNIAVMLSLRINDNFQLLKRASSS